MGIDCETCRTSFGIGGTSGFCFIKKMTAEAHRLAPTIAKLFQAQLANGGDNRFASQYVAHLQTVAFVDYFCLNKSEREATRIFKHIS